jgi:hypothetical protein
VATDTQPTGNFLSTGDTTQTVTVGAVNAVNVSLTSVIGILAAAAPAAYSVWAAPGQSANVAVGIIANDIDGGQIFGQPASFSNPIAFSDGLTGSPFTYPSANPPATLGLTPPETAGPIRATIVYTAPAPPATASVPAATVTVSTIEPDFLPPPVTPPSTTFTLSPMVVSVGGAAVGSLHAVTGVATVVTINELNAAAGFLVQDNADAQTEVTLENATGTAPLGTLPIVPDASGDASFTVFAGAPSAAATAPVITITDPHGTVATLPLTVTAAAPAVSAARRSR